jgi:REP element-mobilizing transposase RayT
MQVLKQKLSRRLRRRRKAAPGQGALWEEPEPAPHFWQRRFYDFNVWSRRKRVEKLRYLHRNPVRRGLVSSPELWRWSSFRWYALGEAGPVAVNQGWRTELRRKSPPAA